jgi:hypothetical protein
MEIAQALQLLWRRKIWLAVGLVVAIAVGAASIQLLKKEEYATAMTQMIVDSPRSPLGNTAASLDPFTARASVFADLMASHPALVEIGEAAGIPPDQIVASAPADTTGTTTVSPTPPAAPQPVTKYKLFLDQDPTLPTVDIYAEAPTTDQAIALANGAVTGFSRYLRTLESQTSIHANQRVEIRQLGQPVGGVVDPHASKKIAAVLVLLVLLGWCGMILLFERKRANKAQSHAAAATATAVSGFDDDQTDGLPAAGWRSDPEPDLEIDSVRNGGRRDTRIKHSRMTDRDATLAEFATVAKPSSRPDEA